MPSQTLVLGYHGCEKEVAEKLVAKQKPFKPSTNKYDWLGHGIYFWEDSPQRAFEWATQSKNIENPAVIGAVIDLGVCLSQQHSNMTPFSDISSNA